MQFLLGGKAEARVCPLAGSRKRRLHRSIYGELLALGQCASLGFERCIFFFDLTAAVTSVSAGVPVS